MKIFVITDAKGRVIGSVPVAASYPADAPSPGRPTALRGQRVHEVDIPDELRKIESAVEFHRQLEKHVARRPARAKASSGKAPRRSR